jgi:hypothetical protein
VKSEEGAYGWARGRALADIAAAVGAGGEGVGGSDHSEEGSEDGEGLHFDDLGSCLGVEKVPGKISAL